MFQHIPGLAQPTDRAALSHVWDKGAWRIHKQCVYFLPSAVRPCAPSAVATIVYRVVQVYFCSASIQLFRCSQRNETNTSQQLVFPFHTGTPFSSDPADRDCFEADCLTWRSQGQVNNIIAAVEKCHWQLEKVWNFTPWTQFSPEEVPVVCCPLTKENVPWHFAGQGRQGMGRWQFFSPSSFLPHRETTWFLHPTDTY